MTLREKGYNSAHRTLSHTGLPLEVHIRTVSDGVLTMVCTQPVYGKTVYHGGYYYRGIPGMVLHPPGYHTRVSHQENSSNNGQSYASPKIKQGEGDEGVNNAPFVKKTGRK